MNGKEDLAIISLDYSKPSSLYEAEKILRQYIDLGRHYEWYISMVLQHLIERSPNVQIYIDRCDRLCCDGLTFLRDLAFDYGLRIRVTPASYSAENWYELTSPERVRLIDSFYPDIAREAQKILNGLRDRQIVIIDVNEENKSVDYLDNCTNN